MTAAITFDPALKRFLDELPQENPDEYFCQVWVPWCEGRHMVAVNKPVTIPFGTWFGPPMKVTAIPIKARYLGFDGGGYFSDTNTSTIYPKDWLEGDLIIWIDL